MIKHHSSTKRPHDTHHQVTPIGVLDRLRGDVTQYLERITVAVLGQELLTHSALEMALMPILQGTWEEDPRGWQGMAGRMDGRLLVGGNYGVRDITVDASTVVVELEMSLMWFFDVLLDLVPWR